MSAIAGRLSWRRYPERSTVIRMIDRMAHRGTAHVVCRQQGPMALGHGSRVTAAPMADMTGVLWLALDGRIFNHRELRRELEMAGVRFQTHSDAELILESYREWGVACLRKLVGMFAFALWDDAQETLFIARDRLGEKPLCYYPLPCGGVVFATEMTALLADPELPRQVDPVAMGHYLSLNYPLHGQPLLQGVHRLAPASFLLANGTGVSREYPYWNLSEFFHRKVAYKSDAEAAEACNALLEESVRQRMAAAAPVAVLLGGGLNSAAVAATLARVAPDEQIQAFAASFHEPGQRDEHKVRTVASLLGVALQEEVITSFASWQLPELVRILDEPLASATLFPLYRLAAMAGQQVTTVLAGCGGDALFGGYPTYSMDQLHQATRWLPHGLMGGLAGLVRRAWPTSLMDLQGFLAGHGLSPGRAHYSWRLVFDDQEKRRLVHPEWLPAMMAGDPYPRFAQWMQDVEGCHFLDQAMYVDIKTRLVDDTLAILERTGQAHGLEIRCPFLDHRLVEFAASLPVRTKIRGWQRKHLLKHAQAPWLPSRVLHGRKEGFFAPISRWLLAKEADALSRLRQVPLAPDYCRQDQVARLWHEMAERSRDNSRRLLGLIVLHLWLDMISKS